MIDLTNRQITILKHIIDEYIETASPVGSETLDRKFNLGVSPATLRNEMAALSKSGYLSQPHVSSGRSPTPMALKYYVSNLMEPKKMSVTDEVKIKEKVMDYKNEFEKALREATKELAEVTKSLAVSSDNDDNIYSAGTANILDMPEFFDIDLTRNVLGLLDHFDYLNRILSRGENEAVGIQILFGNDLVYDYLSPCAMVFTRFGQGKKYQGTIGVLGPYRLDYPRLIPTIEYFGDLIDQLEVV